MPTAYHVAVASRFPEDWQPAWEALAEPYGHLLQHPAWAALKAQFGWKPAWVLVTQGGRPVAAAQVLFRRLPLGFSLAYIPRGPMAPPDNPPLWRTLVRHLDVLCRQERAILLKVEPEWEDAPAAREFLQALAFRPAFQTVQPRSTIHVDLTPPEEAILARMKSKWRYNIRLAGRKGVTVRPAAAGEVGTFVRLLQETARRDGFAIHTPQYYRQAWASLHTAGLAELFLAWYEDRVLAGLFVAGWGRTAVYLYGASSNEERHRMPNHLLQWEAMRWAKARGFAVYDLWGIPDEVGAHPEVWAGRTPERTDGLWGVYRFKQGFGGRIVRYVGAWDRVYAPRLYWAYRLLWRFRQGRAA